MQWTLEQHWGANPCTVENLPVSSDAPTTLLSVSITGDWFQDPPPIPKFLDAQVLIRTGQIEAGSLRPPNHRSEQNEHLWKKISM